MATPGHVCIHASTPVSSVRICIYVYVSISRLYLRQYLHRISVCVHIRISACVSLSVSGSFPGTYTPTGSCAHIHPHAYPCIYIYECSSFANFMLVEVTAKEDDTRSSLTTGPLRILFFLLILIYIKIECSRDLGFLKPRTIIPALPR